MKRASWLARILFGASLALFRFSLSQPAFGQEHEKEEEHAPVKIEHEEGVVVLIVGAATGRDGGRHGARGPGAWPD